MISRKTSPLPLNDLTPAPLLKKVEGVNVGEGGRA